MNTDNICAALVKNFQAQAAAMRLQEEAYRQIAGAIGTGNMVSIKEAVLKIADAMVLTRESLNDLADAYDSQTITVKTKINLGHSRGQS